MPWVTRHLLPRPARVIPGIPLKLALGRLVAATEDPRLLAGLKRANAQLERLPGGTPSAELPVQLEIEHPVPAAAVPALDSDSSYRLVLDEHGVRIHAANQWGALCALATLTQFLSLQDQLYGITIEDAPRFPWRGVLLDPARRFLPLTALKRTISGMSAMKLNTLHLHLTDDQGIRFPSRRWPRLPSQDHYSRAELEQLVAFAADHGVRVVPELDVPGHVTAWLTAYPRLGLEGTSATRRFGVHRAALNPIEPLVFEVLRDLLDEVIEVFPDACIHLGGDEVHPEAWARSAAIDAFMAEAGLDGPRDLQAWFTERLVRMVLDRGRTPILWDEALHQRLAPFGDQLIFMCWRGATWRDRALAQGHRCVVAAGAYLDLNYPAQWHYRYDPAAPQAELIALEDELLTASAFGNVADGLRWTHQWRAGQVDPLLPGTSEQLVLGGQACLWGELVDDATLDQRLWSRLPALAELWWTPPQERVTESLPERLLLTHSYLEATGLIALESTFRRQAEGLGINLHWQRLLAWLEPVKWYGRLLGEAALAARIAGGEMPQARPYQTTTALDRLVDMLPPESLATRQQFEPLLADDLTATGLRYLLRQWRDLLSDQPPPLLVPHAARLTRLLELLEREVNEGEPVQSQELGGLLDATDDIQLAPAHALHEYLRAREQRQGQKPGQELNET